jgi:ribosomal-protein-serine acetyltransferase
MKEPVKTITVTEDIQLKQLELSDANDIFTTINRQRDYLGEWLPFVALTKEMSDSEEYIRSVLAVPAEKGDFVFVIRYKDGFAGLIGFKDTDNENRKTEIGYWLSEPYQKKGIITSSVMALIRFAFEEMNLNRIQIKCAVGNFPSKSIPQRLGFHFEGIERDGELLTGNCFTDIEVYSLLKNEFLSAGQ